MRLIARREKCGVIALRDSCEPTTVNIWPRNLGRMTSAKAHLPSSEVVSTLGGCGEIVPKTRTRIADPLAPCPRQARDREQPDELVMSLLELHETRRLLTLTPGSSRTLLAPLPSGSNLRCRVCDLRVSCRFAQEQGRPLLPSLTLFLEASSPGALSVRIIARRPRSRTLD